MTIALDVVIVTGDEVNLHAPLFGQETYLNMLMQSLPALGFKVEIFTAEEFIKGIETDVLRCPHYIHLYYTNFRHTLRIHRLCRDSKIIYHIYHLDDATWSRSHRLKWNAFLNLIRPFIDTYLVTSKSLLNELRRRGLSPVLVEPYYACSCKSFYDRDVMLEKFNSLYKEARMFYIGRAHPLRFPLRKILIAFNKSRGNFDQILKFTVVSTELRANKTMNLDGITLTLLKKQLSDQEKCTLYRDAHFFIYVPRGNVAMNPPITLIEAVYHLAVPIVTHYVTKDLKFPAVNVVARPEDLPMTVKELSELIVHGDYPWEELVRNFSRFYDMQRFLKQLKLLHNT